MNHRFQTSLLWLLGTLLILISCVAAPASPPTPSHYANNAEIILPLSPAGQKLYNDIWTRFEAAPSSELN